MAETEATTAALTGRTAWTRNLQTPLRSFLRTETGSAAVLLAGALAAFVWANADLSSYERVWSTTLSIHVGSSGIAQTLRGWVDSGLMTFFFFVVGLEARREFDLGELRERRRFAQRLRAYLLTISVVDDVVALLVIAIFYSQSVSTTPLLVAIAIFGGMLAVRASRISSGPLYLVLGTAMWVAFYKAGVDPLITGLLGGVIALAYPAQRGDLERATALFRLFREQPTPELARSAQAGARSAVSPNDRLQALWHPWSSYVI